MQSAEPFVQAVDAHRLESTVRHLAAYPTRNTLSPLCADACAWLASQFAALPGVQVELMPYTLPQGRRVPQPATAVQVVATLPGLTERRVLMGGHVDSLNLAVPPDSPSAPGANDDASGVAATLECARVMAEAAAQQGPWNQTLVFAAFTGEEQGLLGATALAARAQREDWTLEAVLNNDTIGSSSNLSGQSDPRQVRVFSEESPRHHSRELARLVEWAARHGVPSFGVKLVLRRDRFGRGGDHTPFANAGFNAVRLIEVHEEYARQHTPDDLPDHMDFGYLANVARVNIATLAPLAEAAPAPTGVRLVRDQSHDTTLAWNSIPGVSYTVWSRDTASAVWQSTHPVGPADRATLEGMNKDDHFFAVSAEGGLPVPAF